MTSNKSKEVHINWVACVITAKRDHLVCAANADWPVNLASKNRIRRYFSGTRLFRMTDMSRMVEKIKDFVGPDDNA